MARARNIKPGFFKNEHLADLPPLTRLLFQALWCEADREGRLEERPRKLAAEYFAYDAPGEPGISTMLEQLQHSAGNFIVRYAVEGVNYIQIVNFKKHQNPHVKELPSTIPAPPEKSVKPLENKESGASTIPAPCKHFTCLVLAGLIPDSPLPFPDVLKPISTTNTDLPENERNIRETVQKHQAAFLAIGPFTDFELNLEVEAIVQKTRDKPLGLNAFNYIKEWLLTAKSNKERRNVRRNPGSAKEAGGKKSGITEANDIDADWLGTGS